MLLIVVSVLFAGCSTYPERVQAVRQSNLAGDYAAVAVVAAAQAEDAPKDALVWRLEAGAALRAQGRLAESVQVFEEVEQLLRAEEARPDFSVGGETLAAFSNDYSAPYRAKPQDRIYASTYQALNRLELGQRDATRVSLARLRFVQETFGDGKWYVRKSASPPAAEGGRKYDLDRAARDPRTRAGLAAIDANLAGLGQGGSYDDAFSHWLQGMYLLRFGVDAADREKARKELLAATQLNPQCAAFAADLRECEGSATSARVVYVVLETGLAPEWFEQRVDIPVFLATGNLPYVSVALPALRPSWSDYNYRLKVDGKDQVVGVASRPDALIARHFAAAFPTVRARAFTSAGLKAAASWALNSAAQQHASNHGNDAGAGLVRLLTQVGTAAYTVGTTRADLRNWSGLPARFSLARLEAAVGAQLTVPGHPEANLVLPAGRVLLVTLKSSAENNFIQARCTILAP